MALSGSARPPPDAPFWQQEAAAVLAVLSAGPGGLTGGEAARRLASDGANAVPRATGHGVALALLRRFANPLIAILLIAAGIAGATGDIASFVIITTVVVASVMLDLVQEHRAHATAEALRRSIALSATVLRDGTWSELPVAGLVRGDVVRMRAGDLVPADGLLLDANALQVNQAAITGESFPVEKRPGTIASAAPADATNALFQGSAVVSGSGTLLIVATGRETRFGAIAAALADAQPPTAFERGVHRFGLVIVRLTLFLVLFVLVTHLALGRPPLQSFLFALALAVGLTPELLPMIMTIALARGAERMAARRVIVKRLSAIHDLGAMDVLCTDKTGTLTEARITLDGHPDISGEDSAHVIELAAINATFETGLKSPLDAALLAHADPHVATWIKIDERPFDFERRRVSVLADCAGQRFEIVKGAPEAVLPLCTAVEEGGRIGPLDSAARARLAAIEQARTAQGLRLLAVAFKPADGMDHIIDEAGFTLAGYCAFVDPPKASAAAAIARLAGAGIRVKIISGDAAAVVQHVVASLGIELGEVLTGEDLTGLDEPALAACVDRVDLYARVSPDQKTRIVRALLARGHIVGFLGDGINDAPAIRAADVGLSVDGATDVARDAADIILLESDLGVLADGVAEGRRTHANIMKYIRMGTSSNVGNMVTMAVASLWLPFLPLTAVQVLLNNLLYDLSQTGLPFDTCDPADIATPQRWDMRALIRFTAIMAPLSSLFDFATFGVLLWVFEVNVAVFRAGWFIESMATQILVVLVIRTMQRAWRSRPHPVTLVTLFSGLALACALPLSPLAAFVGLGRPGLAIWLALLGLTLAYLATAELLKGFALRSDLAPRHGLAQRAG